ncbi:HEAT repeat domain-containing protein [Streptomyces althioticus]|uniref:HEAT repeat domain-containing protein n=1 Tax=Streptomyces althioticus TaxID=83380 RepID=UPI00340E7797
MDEWITAALCPEYAVSVNGREQGHSSPATALAYVVMGRLVEYDLWRGRGDDSHLPDLLGDDPMPSREWAVVQSVLRLLLDESREFVTADLAEMAVDSELNFGLRTISCLFASIGYAELEMCDRSIAICEDLLHQAPNLPFEHVAILELQACLRNAEMKNYSQALQWAKSSSISLRRAPLDTIEEKASEVLLFSAAENVNALREVLEKKLFPPGVTRPEIPYAWLELESTVGSAALEYMTEVYKGKIRNGGRLLAPHVIKNEDSISRNLYSYFVRVQLAGHWRKYLQASSQLGAAQLLRPFGSTQDVSRQFSEALACLRRGWASGSYKEALGLVREEGPLDALDSELQKALTRIQTDISDLEMHVVRAGAPLLRADEAHTVCRSLLEASLPRRASRANGWYLTQVPLWDAVSALARELSDGDYLSRRMRLFVGDEDTTQAFHIQKVASALDWRNVSSSEQGEWVKLISSAGSVDDDWQSLLDTVLYRICRTGNRQATELLRRVSDSSMTLARAAHITDLPEQSGLNLLRYHSASIVELCNSSIAETRDNAARNAWSFGGYNSALIAAVLSVRIPDMAMWETIEGFLCDTAVAAEHKNPVLDYLASKVGDVPRNVLHAVTRYPERLESKHPSFFSDSSVDSGARLRFLCAASAIRQDQAYDVLTRLASAAEPAVRVEAVESIPFIHEAFDNSIALGCLLNMTMDSSVFVRARAAEALGIVLKTAGPAETMLSNRLIQMLGADGVAVPFGALRGLQVAKEFGIRFNQSEIEESLYAISRDHSMARVRRVAESLLS